MRDKQTEEIQSPNPPSVSGFHLPLLLWGAFLMVTLSFLPFFLNKPNTETVDHTLAFLVFWSMSASLVRGFGYIPSHRLPRWLLGGWAVVLSLLVAVIWWFLQAHR